MKFNTDAEDIQQPIHNLKQAVCKNCYFLYCWHNPAYVAGFGIYNILNMIHEKMDTIAILKATGFAGRDVLL
jgi:lipoprotein-releasing system permease protein